MEVSYDRDKTHRLLDILVERCKMNQYPYNRKDAVILQRLIPEEIRKDKKVHALFYFYACIYMRGSIKSVQAFSALIRMWKDDPRLFDPAYAQTIDATAMQAIVKPYIGWDSAKSSRNWVANSARLMRSWGGDPLNLLKGLREYPEATQRIMNKSGKKALREAGPDGEGFYGYQEKMVSMLLYFYDWEGWLEERFTYPAPADFHNFRAAVTYGALVITPMPNVIRANENLAGPWRDAVTDYIVTRNADPVMVADALWMFSSTLCANSPVAKWSEPKDPGMFAADDLPSSMSMQALRSPKNHEALNSSCLRCPILDSCSLAIPSKPYYTKGLLVLNTRPRIEEYLPAIDPDTPLPIGEQKEVSALLL